MEVQFPDERGDLLGRVPPLPSAANVVLGVAGGTVVLGLAILGIGLTSRQWSVCIGGDAWPYPADRGVVSGWLMIVGHQRGYRHLCDGSP